MAVNTFMFTKTDNIRIVMKNLFLLLILQFPFALNADGYIDIENMQYTPAMQSFDKQIDGWEWIFFDDAREESMSYPVYTNYYTYSSHPDYIVLNNGAVFDINGSLIHMAYLVPKVEWFNPSENSEIMSSFDEYESENQRLNFNEQLLSTLGRLSKIYLPDKYCITKYSLNGNGAKIQLFLDNYELYRGSRFSMFDSCIDTNSAYDSKTVYIIAKGPKTYQQLLDRYDEKYVYKLSNKDINKLEKFITAAKSETGIQTTIHDVDEKGKVKFISILPIYNDKKTSINIRPSHRVRIEDYNDGDYMHSSGIIYECRTKLLRMLMINDYQNNKYNVQSESTEIKSFIEYRLGLRGRASAKTWDNEVIADNYIEQLKNDHNDDMIIQDIVRVNDLAFNVLFAKNRIMRVNFFPDKYLTYNYEITYMEN